LSKLKEDIIFSWNEVNEALVSLDDLENHEDIEMKEKIIENVREGLLKVQKWLGEYINNEDIEDIIL
jgi:hypothetical protein